MENIFLIGFRCTGKSSVGRRLAERLSRPFLDTDAMIVEEANMTIRDIVAARGWAYFRSREKRIVRTVCGGRRRVIATGGGVVLDPENVSAMGASGVRIWLRADLETIRQRLEGDRFTPDSRPALTPENNVAEIGEVMSRREPLYRGAADREIHTDHLGITEISDRVMRMLGLHSQGQYDQMNPDVGLKPHP